MHTHDYNFPIVQASALGLVLLRRPRDHVSQTVACDWTNARGRRCRLRRLSAVDWRVDVGCTLHSGVHTHAFVRVSCFSIRDLDASSIDVFFHPTTLSTISRRNPVSFSFFLCSLCASAPALSFRIGFRGVWRADRLIWTAFSDRRYTAARSLSRSHTEPDR